LKEKGFPVWIYKVSDQGKGNFQHIDLLLPIHPHFLFDEDFRRRYYRSLNRDPEAGLSLAGLGRSSPVFLISFPDILS
jgi:hypothetical protein